ncbi:hypothetical protein [Treponema sp. UBA7567]|uniref:hypothetical protein n=1 Tax=Treponema sp. UBA7567 TaxID=1947748 RepID=UPI0025E288B2|nr:hypothetical protein [Treponema sp. UBA7567]
MLNIEEDKLNDLLNLRSHHSHNFLHWIGRKKSGNKAVLDIKEIVKNIGFGDDWVEFYD